MPSIESIPYLPAARSRPAAGFAVALACVSLALAARLALRPTFPHDLPFVSFFPAVILTSFLAGTLPALLSIAASLLLGDYFFLPPAEGLKLDLHSGLRLASFLLVSLIVVALLHAVGTALDRLRSERERADALARSREVLFRELQHRISNSLQLVSGLMTMQRGRVSDPEGRRALENAAHRLVLIGKLHRQLHDPTGRSVRFDDFLQALCRDIVEASGRGNIVCLVRAEAVPLGPERTIPLAMAVSELVNNALAHGLDPEAGGTITVTFERESEGRFALAVTDDGTGLAEGHEARGGLGLRVLRALAAQVDGEFALFADGRTVARLAFPG